MTTLTGIYYKGKLKFDSPLKIKGPVKVRVTIEGLGEEEKKAGLNVSDFSFKETQEMLKDSNTSFSDDVINERREEL